MNKRILFIVSEDHYFVSHRLHLGKNAINEGYKVGVLCHLSNYHHIIKESGLKIFNWFWSEFIKSFSRTLFNYELFLQYVNLCLM